MIEVIIVIAILTTIAGFGLFANLGFYKRYALNSDRDILTNVLGKARNSAMNNLNQSAHGVFIEPNRYTIFQGSSYVSRRQERDQVFIASPAVALSGLQEIIFQQLSGDASASGTIILTSGEINRAISINYEGRIDAQ